MNRQIHLILAFLLLFSIKLYATHNKSGEITYKHISGLTYEFTIKTYTYTDTPADRCELELFFGDGNHDTLQRINGPEVGGCLHFGEVVAPQTKMNIYKGQHTYSAIGTYTVYMEDPNRNGGIINIPNSVNVPFYIESLIRVFDTPDHCVVNSIDFFSTVTVVKPIDDNHFKFNLTAFDPDNDSISYELVPCKGEAGMNIPGYYIPAGVSLNPYNGEFRWNDATAQQGEYNFAAKIKKWRNGQMISYVIKDFSIIVSVPNSYNVTFSGTDSLLIDVHGNYYTILDPNDTLNLIIKYTDSDISHHTQMLAYSELFLLENPAIFSFDSLQNVSNGHLEWIPDHVNGKRRPYLFTFRGCSLLNQDINYLQDFSLFVYVRGNNDTICPPFSSINENNKLDNLINVYPNPAQNVITIDTKINIPQKYDISIWNIQGLEVIRKKVNFINTYTVDISCLSEGIYFLCLQNEKEKYFSKIVIQK